MNSQYGDCSFTQFLNQRESELVSNFVMATQTSTKSANKNSRGKHFSHEEDVIIVNAWLTTSLDGVVGTGQKMKQYWNRIHEYYHECKKPNHQERSAHSLSNRWSTIQCSVNKFCGCLAQIENSSLSGYSEDNKFNKAKVTYKDDNGADFLFDHCWEILKVQPKWILKNQELTSKKTAKSTQMDHCRTLSSQLDLENESGPSTNPDFPERPPGRKAQKENKKKRKSNEAKSARLKEIVTKLGEERKQLHDEKMAKIDALAQIEERKASQKERTMMYRIMMMDISGFDEAQQEYF